MGNDVPRHPWALPCRTLGAGLVATVVVLPVTATQAVAGPDPVGPATVSDAWGSGPIQETSTRVTPPGDTATSLPTASPSPVTTTTKVSREATSRVTSLSTDPAQPPSSATLRAPSAIASCDTPGTTGWLANENRRAGTKLPQLNTWGLPAVGAVEGYADAVSARCGEHVGIHLSGPTSRVRLVAYRLGWYDGAGARRVWRSDAVSVKPGPIPSPQPGTNEVTPQWPMTTTVPVTVDWTPGLYLLVPMADSAKPKALGAGIPIVVQRKGATDAVTFMASTMTWHAYNPWGGWSLYQGPSGTTAQRYQTRARVVSTQRPLINGGYEHLAVMDIPAVLWLEKQGFDVSYTTDLDVDADPASVLAHRVWVTGGHSEYWTKSMYDALVTAHSRGVSSVFLGANNVWWRARVSPNRQRIEVYREQAGDPMAATNPADSTVLWGQDPLRRNISALTGQSHGAVNVRGGLQLVHPPRWMMAGTALTHRAVLPHALGNEVDIYEPQQLRPLKAQVIAAGWVDGPDGAQQATATYVTNASGAAIFSAGTTMWTCQLIGRCPGMRVHLPTTRVISRMSANIITEFSTAGPGIRHPSSLIKPPFSIEDYEPLARGTYTLHNERS